MASRISTEISEPENLSRSSCIPFGFFSNYFKVVFANIIRIVFYKVGKLGNPRSFIWQRNVNPPLEPPANGWIERPRQISSSKHQHSLRLIANAVHLHQKLRLDSPTRLIFAFGPE
jgi:hypothetical protein